MDGWMQSMSILTKLTGAGVTQSPRDEITEERRAEAFWCDPISDHNTLFWYWQTPGGGPEHLIHFQNEAVLDDSQLPKDRFSAERSKGANSTLRIQPVQVGDSAVYLCASSSATAVQRHFPQCTQPHGSPPTRLPAALDRALPVPIILGKKLDFKYRE
uniref:Immunoglobulin V-set domain-containing protein n=1 Tax=Spermophilus dauricus TaxID=99837 RepID=A0A8C9PE43_SPEDA